MTTAATATATAEQDSLEALAPDTVARIEAGEWDDLDANGDTYGYNSLLDSLDDDLSNSPDGSFVWYEVLRPGSMGTLGWIVGLRAPGTSMYRASLLLYSDVADEHGRDTARAFVSEALEAYTLAVAE